jgi:hypothetical protein
VAAAGSAADRGVDRASAGGEAALGERQIDPLDLALAHRLLQRRVGLVVAGDDEQAAGALVEPMNDPWSLRVGAATEDLGQLVDQGWAVVRWRWMDD